MASDVPALPGVPDGRQYRAWDGALWNDRDRRDVHSHTHRPCGPHAFSPLTWIDDGHWGSIKEVGGPRRPVGSTRRRAPQ